MGQRDRVFSAHRTPTTSTTAATIHATPAMTLRTTLRTIHAAIARTTIASALLIREDPVFSFSAMPPGYSPASPDRHAARAVVRPRPVEEQAAVGPGGGRPVGA